MLTLRDINRTLDHLGVEPFIPHTARLRRLRERHGDSVIGRWRRRWIARRRIRELLRRDDIGRGDVHRVVLVIVGGGPWRLDALRSTSSTSTLENAR